MITMIMMMMMLLLMMLIMNNNNNDDDDNSTNDNGIESAILDLLQSALSIATLSIANCLLCVHSHSNSAMYDSYAECLIVPVFFQGTGQLLNFDSVEMAFSFID